MPPDSLQARPRPRQGIFWILTVPHHEFVPFLPVGVAWIRGQLELGDSGFLHWQFIVGFRGKRGRNQVREVFGPFHCELTRSSSASDYVWKESTRVAGTQFELGARPIAVASSYDWDHVWRAAVSGSLMDIPAAIRVRLYASLRRIQGDFAVPVACERDVQIFWGESGSGKSFKAWGDAGLEAYPKDPRSKFWCGYRGQENVVMDEFDGAIDLAHLLRWLDCYPVSVETKGGSVAFCAKRIWITSNVSPVQWYPNASSEQHVALQRRCTVTNFTRAGSRFGQSLLGVEDLYNSLNGQ